MVYFGLALFGAFLDLYSKHAVFAWRGNPARDNEWWIIEGFFGIETSLNNGALFGVGQGYQLVFAITSLFALAGVMFWLFRMGGLADPLLTPALGLVSAGIVGNFVDRIGLDKLPGTPSDYQNAVRDWILFRFGDYTWPNFNLADSYLVVGATLLLAHAIWFDQADPVPEGKSAS